MGRLVPPLLFFLARCTRNQLIRNIECLKVPWLGVQVESERLIL
jgi:hypothetical protein